MFSSEAYEASPNDDFDFEKELDSYIESGEKSKMEKQEPMERPGSSMDKSPTREHSDNEDSEVDDYNLTEDQKRALEELDNLKTELGYPDEDPPEYDVKERLKVLNEDLKNDPTPLEKQKDSRVGFKPTLVDLVAPPPDYGEESAADEPNSPKNKPPQKQSDDKADKENAPKENKDKVDDNSETISGSGKKSNTGKKDNVLIEIDGQFQLVSSDDVRAKDLGLPLVSVDAANKENVRKGQDNESNNRNNNFNKLQPTPPGGKPRPATAATNSRRNVRTTPAKQRPQSATITTNHSAMGSDFNYNSPYALSPREKQLLEERKKAHEKQKKDQDRRRREEDENKEKENRDAFEYWLKKKRESDRRKKIQDDDDRRKNDKQDRQTDNTSQDSEDNEEAFRGWLKEKSVQFKKEKLLKKREEQEMHEGYYIRSREECDKAYKLWLKQKAIDARRARVSERQKSKLQRLAARRARKSINLSKSVREAQSFRYVDYYGYRF